MDIRAHQPGPTVGLGLLIFGLLLCAADPGTSLAAPWRLGARPAGSDVGVATAASGDGCRADGWRPLGLPGSDGSIAMDVDAVGDRAAWVVGMHAGVGVPRRPWAVRRTSTGWRSIALPAVGSDAGLVAVDAVADSAAWAVGFEAIGRDLRPVAVRWSSGRWRDVSPAWGSGGSATLTDVAAGRETWAVGYRTGPSGPRPYALRWAAGSWQRDDPAPGLAGFGSLTTVSSTRQGTWAAGWWSRGAAIRAVVWHRQHARWVQEALPVPDGPEAVITGLALRDGALLAVGYRVLDERYEPIVLERGPAGWRTVDLPETRSSLLPDSVVPARGGGLTLVGSVRLAAGSNLVHAVASPLGGILDVTRRPAAIGGNSHLRAGIRDGRELMAVGWTDGRAIVLRSCAAKAMADPARSSRVWMSVAPGSPARMERRRTGVGSPARLAEGASRPARGDASVTVPARARPVVFRDVADRAGLGLVTVTYGATRLDVDGDGWDDLLISRHQQRARLLLGRPGRFVPAAGDPLPRRDRHGCAAADIDADGGDEAYCAIGASRGVKLKSNELYGDLGTRRPVTSAGPAGVADHLGRGRHATFLDLDGDDPPDLLVTNDPLRVDGLPSLNRLFRSTAAAGSRGVPELGLDLPLGGTCALSAQLDGTGRQEIAVCTEEPWHGARGLHVFRFTNGRYADATRALGISADRAIDAVAADFDGDGRTDLAQLSASRLVISLQRAGRLRQVAAVAIGHGRAVAAGDVNGDQLADLYVVRGGPGNADDRLLVNLRAGRAYRSAAIPQARSGGADDVIAIDHDHNGLTDFLVLNGLERAGPLQLIAAFRR